MSEIIDIMVSVKMLSYKHEKYIAAAIQSVLSQVINFRVELIIADDHSPDDTEKVVREIINNYQGTVEIKYFRQPVNKGAGINGVEALRMCRGKYIALCEGDDYWTDVEKLQRQVDFLEAHPEYAIHCGHAVMISEDSSKDGKRIHEQKDQDRTLSISDFTDNSPIPTCTATFRNTGYKDFSEEFLKVPAGDWYNWIYILQRTGGKVFFENRDLAAYRVHAGGIYSRLNTREFYVFYEKTLAGISKLFKDRKLKCKSLLKRNWYLEQLFRCELAEGNKWKALRLLPDMLYHGYPFRSAVRLLSELKQGWQKRSVAELSD